MATRKSSPVDQLYTPQLASTSKTTNKMNQKPFKHRLNEVDSTLDLVPQLETKQSKRQSDVNEMLQKQRELAKNTLKRDSAKFSSLFKTPVREDSTINESDILRVSGISNFGQNVHVSSTPRTSAKDSLDFNAREVAEESRRQSEMFEALIHKLKTSGMNTGWFSFFVIGSFCITDITISEVCKEFQDKISQSVCTSIRDVDSDCFVPAELALEKIKADELSWRKEKDLPVENFTEFSQISNSSFKDKVSVGEFFQQRSEDIKNIIPNISPEKTHNPVPLIESSNISNSTATANNRESLSITEIVKLLSEMNDGNATAIISQLLKNKNTTEDKENISPSIPSLNSTACQTDGRESDISPRILQHDKSLSSLRSGSALSSLPNGKLPIETTRTQLIWGCIKLGKSSVQEFVLRNRSQNRLRIQVKKII